MSFVPLKFITTLVSTTIRERTFFCVKRIKTYRRNSMLQINFFYLSITPIEKSEAKHLKKIALLLLITIVEKDNKLHYHNDF